MQISFNIFKTGVTDTIRDLAEICVHYISLFPIDESLIY